MRASQAVVEEVPAAKALFEKANDILGYDLLQLCVEGDPHLPFLFGGPPVALFFFPFFFFGAPETCYRHKWRQKDIKHLQEGARSSSPRQPGRQLPLQW